MISITSFLSHVTILFFTWVFYKNPNSQLVFRVVAPIIEVSLILVAALICLILVHLLIVSRFRFSVSWPLIAVIIIELTFVKQNRQLKQVFLKYQLYHGLFTIGLAWSLAFAVDPLVFTTIQAISLAATIVNLDFYQRYEDFKEKYAEFFVLIGLAKALQLFRGQSSFEMQQRSFVSFLMASCLLILPQVQLELHFKRQRNGMYLLIFVIVIIALLGAALLFIAMNGRQWDLVSKLVDAILTKYRLYDIQ